MKTSPFSFVALTVFALSVAGFAADGAVTSVKLTMSPTSVALLVGQSQQFTASVTGTENKRVRWLVNGIAGGNSTVGTISSAGLYKAPSSVPSGSVAVRAQSVAVTTVSATASLSIRSRRTVSVSISPTSAALPVSHSQQFTASVFGTDNKGVSWSVSGIAGGNATVGTISSSGRYTAPAKVPSSAVVVRAQSMMSPTASASATVSIRPGSAVAVSISPTSVSVPVKQSKQFSAVVSGTTNTTVHWLVNGTVGGNATVGTISSSGTYTAPAAVPSGGILVTAQSAAQPTVSATAKVSVTAASTVSVSISPASATLQVNHSQQFNATVSGSSYTGVKWLVNGLPGGNASVGTISSSGMYTAPAAVPMATITVTAQSSFQPTAKANASVSVQPVSITVSVSPTNASVQTGQTQQFRASVSGTSNTAVKWLVSGILGGNASVGTISAAGLYSAPMTAPTGSVTVTAQSSASPSSSATASVSVTQPANHSVSLSWTATKSSIIGYYVYRGAQPNGPFSKLNSSPDPATVYTDSSVISGKTYYYTTTSVNSSGTESGYSNIVQAVIP